MSYVDELGRVRQQIDALIEREKELRKAVVDNEDYIGDDFTATVYTRTRTNTNWKAIALKLGASKQMIVGNSKKSTQTCVRVEEV